FDIMIEVRVIPDADRILIRELAQTLRQLMGRWHRSIHHQDRNYHGFAINEPFESCLNFYPAFSQATNYSEGMACVSKRIANKPEPGESEFLWGYIDKSGKQVIDFSFESASSFKKGIAVVSTKEGYGYIDPSGKFVIPPKFRLAWEFSEGLARVTVETGQMAFIDRSGQLVFSVPDGGWADPFSEGFANVRIRGTDGEDRWGYIDQTGKFAIPPEFRMAEPFRHGLAAATRGIETGYINKMGHFVWKTTIPADLLPKMKQENK
ncbi:MAG: WG repeat-containing protein, partial [Akkermansiaceae bacterium]|nr:WG repeat-containing protein [Akkermansiaceae bacterium]